MKLLTVIGARPQFIKAATVSRVIQRTEGINECLVHTGQHYDSNMSDVFFKELEIPRPTYDLGIGGGEHGRQTGKMLASIEDVILSEKPDKVLVYGDTNSTLAGALAAAKLHIPVIHVEAGLRSFNKRMPEEINRIMTDHVSDLLFAPTEIAVKNLSSEGIKGNQVVLSGDVMCDAALFYGDKADKNSIILDRLRLKKKAYGLVTIHRAENTDDEERLKAICKGLVSLSKYTPLVFPLHPRTKKAVAAIGMLDTLILSMSIIEPTGYLDMVMLEKNASFIVTDSGGVQKEAYFHKTPCFTLRDETEWVELVNLKVNQLIKPNMLVNCLSGIENIDYSKKIYGTGDAAHKITGGILESFISS